MRRIIMPGGPAERAPPGLGRSLRWSALDDPLAVVYDRDVSTIAPEAAPARPEHERDEAPARRRP